MARKIQDIADDAGVSIATVSRVLNNSQPVSQELRERVMASVDRLGYQPNLLARSLRTRRTFVIGVIVPTIANPYFTDIIRAVEDVALEAGYVVTVCSSDQDLAREQRYMQVLRNRMVDGALVAVAHRQLTDLSPLIDSDVPVVLIDRRTECTRCDSVIVDTRRGAFEAVGFLVERGYRRIAMIAGPQEVSTATDKVEGYLQALTAHDLPRDESLLLYGDYTEESGAELARRLLDRSDRPDAVLLSNNLMTLGFFTVVRERGLVVPRDVAYVAFDDSTWASLVTPPVTLVAQPTYELGRAATELLLDRLADAGAEEPHQVVLSPRLVVRGSA